MSIGSDIYVFLCMGFVPVELFVEWVYNLSNYDYLRFMYGSSQKKKGLCMVGNLWV